MILDLAKRAALRKALTEGETVPRIKKGTTEEPRAPLAEREMHALTNKLDRVIRWNTFLTHTALNAHEQIDSVTKGIVDPDGTDFARLRNKVLENTRSYKNKILEKFEVSVSSAISLYNV